MRETNDNRDPKPPEPPCNGGTKHPWVQPALWVALGSGLGGMARVVLAGVVEAGLGFRFPIGILTVNVLGSFAIGLAAGLFMTRARRAAGSNARHFIMTGLCGGFTTFSFFSLDTLRMLETGRPAAALLYSILTLSLSLAAVWAGHRLTR